MASTSRNTPETLPILVVIASSGGGEDGPARQVADLLLQTSRTVFTVEGQARTLVLHSLECQQVWPQAVAATVFVMDVDANEGLPRVMRKWLRSTSNFGCVEGVPYSLVCVACSACCNSAAALKPSLQSAAKNVTKALAPTGAAALTNSLHVDVGVDTDVEDAIADYTQGLLAELASKDEHTSSPNTPLQVEVLRSISGATNTSGAALPDTELEQEVNDLLSESYALTKRLAFVTAFFSIVAGAAVAVSRRQM
mmetsp:Transcript_23433/g.72989  ORF Transcript_23433/g.72989 Transcript_23433/m.72989 type:complete len:253 (-) Transcript_23433:167-925(-)